MNILVAGGAGYIGSHVCKMLSKMGFNVIVYDNLSKGYKEFAKWGDFVIGDLSDSQLLDIVFKKYKIDAVMHFCAFIEVGESVIDPEKYYINNVYNTINLLEAMRRNKIDKFIFSSTAAVYGMPTKIPIEEDDEKKPINPYGKSKLMIEDILEDYDKAYNFKSIRFRYFNASGADPDKEIGEAHIPESHLIPLILDAAIGRRESIKVFGTDYPTKDGTAVRDYIHVNDLATAHIKGLQYLLDGGNTNYFNLGSGNGYTVKEIIETVKKITKKDFKVIEVERRAGDPPFLIAKSDKAKKMLDWDIKYSLDDIVNTAWEWHQILVQKKL
ncbi:MAG: UDP-glucose 4-epimerase GalE [Spirochaetes bacterium GWD1_27_9]|nr:MAG: UDP-glucose 4-epimerase GalE [Spirochaetes bacterium GWB1_27_13]OHD25633.1 MAG: UDP-glucose 4-epimerase GalE [Spirochaetes bacterium GWC1_27_15]OHD36160.1 MAG: UDP-glucose 4-epimerase GalE [Spirochaetes bacterium GWD1_27_9]